MNYCMKYGFILLLSVFGRRGNLEIYESNVIVSYLEVGFNESRAYILIKPGILLFIIIIIYICISLLN